MVVRMFALVYIVFDCNFAPQLQLYVLCGNLVSSLLSLHFAVDSATELTKETRPCQI